MLMILCNYLLEKRDRCLLYTYLQFSLRRLLPRPRRWGFWIVVFCPVPQFKDEASESWYPNDLFRVAGHLQTWAQRQQGPIYGSDPPPPDCIVTYAYENGHIFPRSFFIFLLSFLLFCIKRSKGVMIAQQNFGGNCQPVQNWLQGQMKRNRANRWRSLKNLSKF